MSHEIEQFGSLAAFVSNREDAWHHLGTVVDGAMDAAQVLELAHLANWNVRKAPLFAHVDGQQVPLTEGKRFTIVRDNPFKPGVIDAFAPVGGHYEPVQNEALTDLLNHIVDESGAHFETAASLRGGREVFVTMKMPNHLEFKGSSGKADPVDLYLVAYNTHDASGSYRFMVSPVRVVCKNTLAAAMGSAKSTFKARHVAGGAATVVREARETLGLTFKYVETFEAEVAKMIEQEYTDQQFTRLAASLFPTPEEAKDVAKENARVHRANLTTLFKSSPTMADIRGTRWAAYNAVTEYMDHLVPQRNKGGDVLREARATNAALGLSAPIKEKAFALLTK